MPILTVSPPTNNLDQTPPVRVNSDIFISSPPTNCSSILSQVTASTNADAFLTQFKLSSVENTSTVQNNLIQNLTTLKNTLTQTRNNQNFFNQSANFGNKETIDYINKIKNETIPVIQLTSDCLSEASTYGRMEDLETQKTKTEESRLRLESIKSPEEKVSYYEGWFPLFRPMTETMIFTLFGTGLLLLLVGLAVFLKMGGISLEFQIAGGGGGGAGFDPAFFFANNKGLLIGGAALGVGVAIGFIGGWFGKK
jgi:hypothetical protein